MSNAKEFDCASCSHRYCGEGVRGSNGVAPYRKWSIAGVGEFNSCLLPMISDQSDFFLRMHKHYVKGILIKSGGLMEQPNKYLEAMEIIG